jgi:aspartyl-tRNA(Asn)/glutamyl-tRNA(Gln) amidotransferase subunit C
MSFDTRDTERIARLARIELAPGEAEAYTRTLSSILELIEQMSAVDTTGIAPLAHPHEAGLRLRADEVTETDRREKFLQIAPATEAGLYLVPKVIE